MGSSAVAITGGGRGKEVPVPSSTLENLISDLGLDHVDLIKVDIEGGETELLKTSGKVMRNIGAKLIIEPHRINGQLNTEECRVLLDAAG
jgi:FkbM family methyltransferase